MKAANVILEVMTSKRDVEDPGPTPKLKVTDVILKDLRELPKKIQQTRCSSFYEL